MRNLILSTSLLFSVLTQAEITEIPAEELTDSYIRDTTIIVRQAETIPLAKKSKVQIKVSPQPYSSAQNIEQENASLDSSTNNHEASNVKAHSPDVYQFLTQQQASTYDHQREKRERDIRKHYNIPYNKPLDLNAINLPVSENGKYDLGSGNSYLIGNRSLEIRVPNSKGFNAQTIKTQDGTYDVQVTPTDVIFKFNLK